MPDDPTEPKENAGDDDGDDDDFELPSQMEAEQDASELRRRVADEYAERCALSPQAAREDLPDVLLVGLLLEQRLMCLQIALVDALHQNGAEVTRSISILASTVDQLATDLAEG